MDIRFDELDNLLPLTTQSEINEDGHYFDDSFTDIAQCIRNQTAHARPQNAEAVRTLWNIWRERKLSFRFDMPRNPSNDAMLARLAAIFPLVSEEFLTDDGTTFRRTDRSLFTTIHGDHGRFRRQEDGKAISRLWNLWRDGLICTLPADLPPADLTEVNPELVKPTAEITYTEASASVEIKRRSFAVQHNPNCASPWLLRLPGKGKVLDMKPYVAIGGKPQDKTGDILGFGQSFEGAALAALQEEQRLKAKVS